MFVDSSGCDGFGGLVLFAPTFERGESVELIGAGAAAAMGHAGDHEDTKPVLLIRAHVFQDGFVIGDGIKGGYRAAGTPVAPTVIDEELTPARFEFGQVRVDGVDFFPVEECSFDVLFEVEVAPIPSGVLIGDVAEYVNVHAAGFGGAGGNAPAEFATEGETWVEEFAGGFPYVSVGRVDRFQLLPGEATCDFGPVAFEGVGVEVAVAGVFEEAVFDTVVGVALVE